MPVGRGIQIMKDAIKSGSYSLQSRPCKNKKFIHLTNILFSYEVFISYVIIAGKQLKHLMQL